MTEETSLDPQNVGPDPADVRLAQALSGESSTDALRHSLAAERSEESEDLLARLDALDFVHRVVGEATDLPGRIAEYEIKGLLGRGGMGTVYLARQEDLERDVALKVLSPAYSADPTMRKRFRAEARATAALHHRHIVPIYDYGEAQGMMFFTMERVEGMSLDKHIAAARHMRRPHMDATEAAHRFAGVADALGLAHRRRLLHRDVKPGNILVADDGTLALTDFGLAKALDNVSANLTSKGGGFLGTLHYSSPEQALGDDLTPASDLYSLGVTIFETVTGELPFAAKSTEALLSAILHGTPRRLRDLVPKVPRDLDAVIEKLLSREPGDRYQDGEALARDLLRIRDGEPVHIRRLPLHIRLIRRARKNPGLASAIAAAVVLLLVSLVMIGFWRTEKGRGLVSRHQNRLVQIATDIGNELGAQVGPGPLLPCLTGIPCAAPPANATVLAAFAAAHDELPEDEQVDAMRSAYASDPLPAASELLARGAGFEALQRYEQAIVEATAARIGGQKDLAVELRLYRLYLGSGVAKLTSSVGHLTDARSDLALASYLRPGASFPRSLLDVLDVVQSSNVPSAVQRLENDLAAAAPERIAVVGRLLWAAAGLRPCPKANLMTFALGYPHRRLLHDLALRLLGTAPDATVAGGRSCGLGSELERLSRGVLDLTGDPAAQRTAAERARTAILAQVHPDSPLRGWSAVTRILEQPQQRGPLTDIEGQPLPPLIQLAAWEALLQLAPPRQTLRLALQRFDELHRRHPNLPGMLPIAARMHVLATSTDSEPATWAETRSLVAAWVAESEGDPTALLWRMRLRLLDGAWTEASDDAMVAVQRSPARRDAIAAVIAICDEVYADVGVLRGAGVVGVQSAYTLLAGQLEGGGR
ncbi:MAG: serine/threonine protein kinase [Planctomycetes bacterium]|nr:serine/threonine protein kinase [Planctomycetota bacterium]